MSSPLSLPGWRSGGKGLLLTEEIDFSPILPLMVDKRRPVCHDAFQALSACLGEESRKACAFYLGQEDEKACRDEDLLCQYYSPGHRDTSGYLLFRAFSERPPPGPEDDGPVRHLIYPGAGMGQIRLFF